MVLDPLLDHYATPLSSVLGADAGFASNSSPKLSLKFSRLQLACSSIVSLLVLKLRVYYLIMSIAFFN